MREILFKAKKLDDGEWVEGFYYKMNETTYAFADDYEKNPVPTHHYIIFERMTDWGLPNQMYRVEVAPETVCQYTGLSDKNGKKICEGDIVKLILPDGEIRHFKVSIKNVVRKVLCHPDFDDEVSRVEITGIVFEWNGYELFPCVDTYGVPDYKMMEVIGNIFDNFDLLGNQEAGEEEKQNE